jgi:hypothetical protein
MRTRGAERAAPPPSGVALHQHAASLTALASLLGYLEFAPCIPGGEGGMGARRVPPPPVDVLQVGRRF